jgi:histidine triad (HIT) family protein
MFFPSCLGGELEFLAMSNDCLFCRMVRGEVPTRKVYEDERVFAFHDINPQAPTHVLIIPKEHIRGLKEAATEDAELLGYCQLVAAKIARERGIEDGYRTVYNVGPRAGQSVFHIHLHLLGGRDLRWPPG